MSFVLLNDVKLHSMTFLLSGANKEFVRERFAVNKISYPLEVTGVLGIETFFCLLYSMLGP